MAKQQRYFLQIPASQGVRGGFYPVDPETVSISMLTELYRIEGSRYVRAYDVGPNLDLANAANLLRRWREHRGQIGEMLPDSGLAGDFTRELLESLNGLPRLIEAVAKGRLGDAESVLTTLGDDLMTFALVMADRLTDLEAQVSELGAQAEDSSETEQERLYAAMAESLADSINEGLRAYSRLVAFEAELDQLIQNLEPLSLTWSGSGQDNWLEQQLTYLNDNSGFSRQSSRFMIALRTGTRDPDLIDLMRIVISGARERIQRITSRLTEARTEHAAAGAQAEAVLESIRVETLIRTMQEAREDVQRLTQSGADPRTLVSGLIKPDEYATWQGLQHHPDWQSLREARARIQEKADLIHRLMSNTPTLSPADSEVLEAAAGYIERVEAALAQLGQPAPEPPPPPIPTRVSQAPSTMTRTKAGPALPSGYDPTREQALYEMMLFIGAVKYCNMYHLTGATPNAIFDLLVLLGQLTTEEREIYNDTLRKRLSRDSHVLEERENRLEAWRNDDPRRYWWIEFRATIGRGTIRHRRWRLVEKAKPAALALGAKYGLNEDQVKAAYDTRLAARRASQ